MSRSFPDAMHWQSYQAYRQGPCALFRLFEETFGKLALCGKPEPAMQQRQLDNLSEHIGRLQAQLEKLRTEVSDLRQLNFRLQCRNAELEGLLTKDSHNCSRPPQPIHLGLSGREACGGPPADERVDRQGIVG